MQGCRSDEADKEPDNGENDEEFEQGKAALPVEPVAPALRRL